eukprot:PLAT4376.2.p1 GENE.PLAT4376.2~~PLAT4376.2.p1  ORF type:complete len:683 (+),score=380.79 PLAT4376.2:233-2050(+)
MVAASLVVCVESVAGGSGIPELKGYLNGSNVARLLTPKALVAKVVGVMFSVGAGLAIGKEGPLVHTGAVVAAQYSHLPKLPRLRNNTELKRFRNDHDKRDFVSAGTAAGVAAAFGAPTGGVLFALEEASSYWSLPLTWRVFFAAMVSSFTLNFFLSWEEGQILNVNRPGLVTFGLFEKRPYQLWELPFFFVIAAIGGALGAVFNMLNTALCRYRRDVVNKRGWVRLLEVAFISIMTSTFQFWAPYVLQNCIEIPKGGSEELYKRYNCKEGFYNDMATLIFSSNEESIKAYFHDVGRFGYTALLLYLVLFFILAFTTYGIAVPSGLFVPCILVGCSYGRMFGELLQTLLPEAQLSAGTYALVGACSMLGGVTRMTISLTIILLETTNDIAYLLPIMMVLMISKWVGDLFNISLYDLHVELKCIPFVESNPPRDLARYTAADMMRKPVVTVRRLERVRDIINMLREHTHNGFPVVQDFGDGRDTFVGLILRNQLITIIRHHAFLEKPEDVDKTSLLAIDKFSTTVSSKIGSLDDVVLTDEEEDMFIDMEPYMNPAPFSVRQCCLLTRVYRIFRAMGLRHLVVVDAQNQVVGMLTRKELRTDFSVDLS